jgi:hypothetical protein
VIVDSVAPDPLSTRQVRAAFWAQLEAAPLATANRVDPAELMKRYPPRAKFALFGTTFFVSAPLQIPELRYFVAYVRPPGARKTSARIFYKDLSLVWRVASHVIDDGEDFWIGKGDVEIIPEGAYERVVSRERTTDLPLEIQTALETLNQRAKRVANDEDALTLVLRNAPRGRVEPYADFVRPRRRAAADPTQRIADGAMVAWFERPGDPSSLVIRDGFAPDFADGIVERSASRSTLYHGRIERFRVLSENRQIQWLFFAAPRHVWIVPPQALTTTLSSYGVRVVDVFAAEQLFVPGYEYHYVADDIPEEERFSQIPAGYAGAPSDYNGDRADASAWLDALPLVREFRRATP